MEASPLVQQPRPSFQPKITTLYQELFQDANETLTEGYWSEFFLLKPDKPSFRARLDAVSADDLLHFQGETQQLFAHAVQYLKAGNFPNDEFAIDSISVFLAGVLSKKYTNPSSDIITVLTGLDEVDTVFQDFANTIETIIRNGRSLQHREKAIQAALSLTSGAYQTSLVSYFTHKDLFPALMKYIQDVDIEDRAFDPFLLLGLLANYNKFELRNPYRLRLQDFVNETSVKTIVTGFGNTCNQLRLAYTEIINDVPESGWSLAKALGYISLGIFAPIKAIAPGADSQEAEQERLAVLPQPEAAVFLAVYDFVYANKIFSYNLITVPAKAKKDDPPFCAYLSLTSCILHHAYRSTRYTYYGNLSLVVLRIIVEDPSLCKRLCDTSITAQVRLCRQRQPFLPPTPSPRPLAAHILDVAVDAINHNLRKRIDIDLYAASMNLIHRLMICMAQANIHFPYHWPLLWQSLLSLIRFLQKYATDTNIAHSPESLSQLFTPLLNTLALAAAKGNSFLPDTAAYDDLSYKLVEHHDALLSFKAAYPFTATAPAGSPTSVIDFLISTAAHFHGVLQSEKETGKVRSTLSTKELHRVIRIGYESLDLPDISALGAESFDVWREGEQRAFMKRVARISVDDVRKMMDEKKL